jgi:hypothetical protein
MSTDERWFAYVAWCGENGADAYPPDEYVLMAYASMLDDRDGRDEALRSMGVVLGYLEFVAVDRYDWAHLRRVVDEVLADGDEVLAD